MHVFINSMNFRELEAITFVCLCMINVGFQNQIATIDVKNLYNRLSLISASGDDFSIVDHYLNNTSSLSTGNVH